MREEPAVISQLVTAVVGIRAWANPCEICAEQSGTEPYFVSRTSIFPCNIPPLLCTDVNLKLLSQQDKQTKPGNLSTKRGAPADIGEHQGIEVFCPSFKELKFLTFM
jgi:hypothetical protein